MEVNLCSSSSPRLLPFCCAVNLILQKHPISSALSLVGVMRLALAPFFTCCSAPSSRP